MKLKTHQLESAYLFLCSVPPMVSWNLPDIEEIKFRVTRSEMLMGSFDVDPYVISISERQNKSMNDLLETMSHELCHLKVEIDGEDQHHSHGDNFKKRARQVCKAFGYKEETF